MTRYAYVAQQARRVDGGGIERFGSILDKVYFSGPPKKQHSPLKPQFDVDHTSYVIRHNHGFSSLIGQKYSW